MSVPQILYRLHWTDADGEEYTVHGVHAAVSALEPVLVDAGATRVQIDVPESRQGRHSRPPTWHPRTPEESSSDELDSTDHRALGRLGRKAFGLGDEG